MQLGDYRLLAQRGAGPDGSAYRAESVRGEVVEVRVLRPARGDVERWPVLSRRLRTAVLLDHPSCLPIRECQADHDPPFVVVPFLEAVPLQSAFADQLPLPVGQVLPVAMDLASALAEAHRLGLTHGRLSLASVLRKTDGDVLLDFTGSDVGGMPAAVTGDPSEDVAALGRMLAWLLTGDQSLGRPRPQPTLPGEQAASLSRLVAAMIGPPGPDRPTAREATERLRAIGRSLEVTGVMALPGTLLEATAPPREPEDALAGRERLGRFRLVRRLGQGGMGTVYEAVDPADGRTVALKVLRSQLLHNPVVVRRFHKEARLLAEVNSPFVTNLLEVNEDAGLQYLVLEFVAGRDLADLLAERRRLDERTALSFMADVCRGLAEAHARGIVHRDIKPENILIANPEPKSAIKLSDFGLARHIDESQSLHVTQDGTILGTPLYMAPEQGQGKQIDARADVYSLGATLFHLLAGRPPFVADSPLAVLSLHANQPPPSLRTLQPDVSDATSQVVEKCLAKSPDARPSDATALLRDLQRLLRGEPSAADAHPRLPDADPSKVLQYDWEWDLEASPEQLWPLVCNTERFNRAAGLPPVRWTTRTDPDGKVRRFGEFRKAGLTAAWEEHPFEWVEGRRFGVLRQYHKGPFKWMVATVELTPRAGGGTLARARVRIEPHGLLGRTAAAIEVGLNGRRAMDRIYRRCDAVLTGRVGDVATVDPFEEAGTLPASRQRRLDSLLERLREKGVPATVLDRLGEFLATAPAQEVARIRPLALARRLSLDPDQVVTACLHGVRLGLLDLLWDILCPVCRIPSEVKDSLKVLRDHGRCEACQLDFDLDFANSVELIFRVHREIREAELGVYCIGGPAHSPHVAAQVRVAAGELLELELGLPEGAYRLRGPQLPFATGFRVQTGAGVGRWDINLARGPDPAWPRVLRAGRQTLALTNDHDRELVVRVERTAPRADALTAARASSLALFRDLFPAEVLSPGQLVSVATLTFLTTDLDDAEQLFRARGDAGAFTLLHEMFRQIGDRVRREGGAVVKTVGAGLVAVFVEPLAAVQAALDLSALLVPHEELRGRLRVGVHRGPAMAATLNDHLDYFGSTVNTALRLPAEARPGEVVLSDAVASDPPVADLLRARGLTPELDALDQVGMIHRCRCH